MPRIKFECDGDIDQETINEFLELAARKQVSCKYETRKAILAKLEAGAAESEREAERQIAEETGQKFRTVHNRNQRAKKKERELDSKSQNESTTDDEPTWTCTECGGTFPMSQTTCDCTNQPEEPQPQPQQRKRKEEPPREPILLESYGTSVPEKKVAETAMKILKRELAKKFHPDAGGSEAEQQVVNYLILCHQMCFEAGPPVFRSSRGAQADGMDRDRF